MSLGASCHSPLAAALRVCTGAGACTRTHMHAHMLWPHGLMCRKVCAVRARTRMHGTYMAHAWHMHGACMARAWRVHVPRTIFSVAQMYAWHGRVWHPNPRVVRVTHRRAHTRFSLADAMYRRVSEHMSTRRRTSPRFYK